MKSLKKFAGDAVIATPRDSLLRIALEPPSISRAIPFSLTGTITDAPNGKVTFAPTTVDTDIDAVKYFYDIEMTDGGGAVSTIIKGVARIIQDITKV
jgi:hypothetical protein